MSSKYIRTIRSLAKMKALDEKSAEALLAAHVEQQDGGPGSGNFGHKGRPGKKGGSAPKGQGGAMAVPENGGGHSVPSNEEYRKALAKEPGRPKVPMGYTKGKTPPLWNKKTPEYGVPKYDFSDPKIQAALGNWKNDPKIQEAVEKWKEKYEKPFKTIEGNSGVMREPSSFGREPLSKEQEREHFEKFFDGPDEKTSKNIEEENKKRKERLENFNSNQEKPSGNLLKGLSGEIDPKEHPEIFANGIVPEGKPHGKATNVSVVRGANGQKVISVKYEDGTEERKTAEEMRDLTRHLSDPAKYLAPYQKRINANKIADSCMNTADWCFEHKNDFDKDSIEYKSYEDSEELFANHRYKRPSPSDSAKMRRERLSNISSKLQPSAVARYKKDMTNEPQITKDVCDIADALGVQMHGLEKRTKTAGDNAKGVCRIQQKIEQDLADDKVQAERAGTEPTLTYDQCVDGLNDLVRYTQLNSEDNLVENYEKTRKMLEDKEYKVVKVKNFYNKDPMDNPYRGLTCVFESPTGTKFEFQFHTPRSLVAKNAMHPIYEIDRGYDPNDPQNSKITKEEHEALQARMRNVSTRGRVPYPKNIEKIEDFPPKKPKKT